MRKLFGNLWFTLGCRFEYTGSLSICVYWEGVWLAYENYWCQVITDAVCLSTFNINACRESNEVAGRLNKRGPKVLGNFMGIFNFGKPKKDEVLEAN